MGYSLRLVVAVAPHQHPLSPKNTWLDLRQSGRNTHIKIRFFCAAQRAHAGLVRFHKGLLPSAGQPNLVGLGRVVAFAAIDKGFARLGQRIQAVEIAGQGAAKALFGGNAVLVFQLGKIAEFDFQKRCAVHAEINEVLYETTVYINTGWMHSFFDLFCGVWALKVAPA